jgi:ribosomal protein L7/L12
MKKSKEKIIISSLLLFLGLMAPVLALAPNEQSFVQSYIAAINGKDILKHKMLVAPESLACINDETKVFFDEVFANAQRNIIPENAITTIEEGVPAAMGLLPSDLFTIPVKPTHQLTIDYRISTPTKVTSVTSYIMLAKRGDQFYEVIACPTKEGAAKIKEVKAEKEKQKIQLSKNIENLPAALKSELKKMLAEGHEIDAVKHYREKTGASLSDATDAIDILKDKAGIQ